MSDFLLFLRLNWIEPGTRIDPSIECQTLHWAQDSLVESWEYQTLHWVQAKLDKSWDRDCSIIRCQTLHWAQDKLDESWDWD